MERMTRQRSAVRDLLGSVTEFRSAQELHELLRAGGAVVGLATVYRTLQALVDAGEVDVIRGDDGEARYRRCAESAHHHHLVCRRCGRTVEVAGTAVEQWAAEVARAHGFVGVEHTAELVGLCEDCAGAPGSDDA